MFSQETKEILKSNKMRQLFHAKCVTGSCDGLIIGGVDCTAEDLAKHYGVKLTKTQKSTKYTGIQDADMGKTNTAGDLTDSRAGDSKEQE
jgi:hypothetical protein